MPVIWGEDFVSTGMENSNTHLLNGARVGIMIPISADIRYKIIKLPIYIYIYMYSYLSHPFSHYSPHFLFSPSSQLLLNLTNLINQPHSHRCLSLAPPSCSSSAIPNCASSTICMSPLPLPAQFVPRDAYFDCPCHHELVLFLADKEPATSLYCSSISSIFLTFFFFPYFGTPESVN